MIIQYLENMIYFVSKLPQVILFEIQFITENVIVLSPYNTRKMEIPIPLRMSSMEMPVLVLTFLAFVSPLRSAQGKGGFKCSAGEDSE